MRNIGIISGFAAFALAACQPAVEEAKVAPHQQYDAKTFFDTTAVSMSSPTAYSFSLDGANLLVATDKSGVFNAAALPVAGGDAAPLTQSPNIATFAASPSVQLARPAPAADTHTYAASRPAGCRVALFGLFVGRWIQRVPSAARGRPEGARP